MEETADNNAGGGKMNRIKCDVNSCKYNEDGQICKAQEINVQNNFGASDSMEFGSLEGSTHARTSMETCCETFAPKSSK
jgi:hypothetical protein